MVHVLTMKQIPLVLLVDTSGSNVTSVAEDEVLRLLVLLRNFAPGWKQVSEGGWNVAEICHRSYDLMDKVVGTVGAGRIGQELMKRLKVIHFNSFFLRLLDSNRLVT
jgi:formate dehydrogenase